MSETKVEIQQRKIRNGIRKEVTRQKKRTWEKLTTEYKKPTPDITITKQTIAAKARELKAGWWTYDAEGTIGKTFSKVIIDEVVKK